MTATLRRTVIVVMAALGVAVLLVWATVAGPTRIVGEPPTPTPSAAPRSPQPTAEPESEQQRDASPRTDRRTTGGPWTSDLLTTLGVIGGLWFLAMLLRALLVQVALRLPDKQLVVDLETLPDTRTARELVVRDHARLRRSLADGDVRNGIVACWVLLEDLAEQAGVIRSPSETATEFVVRFLRRLDVDPRPVAELARLFHEARFSTHDLDESARGHAESALDSIHRDLVQRAS